MAKKKSVSSPREKRLPASALFTTPLRDRERTELESLAGMADSPIDYSDAPARRDGHAGQLPPCSPRRGCEPHGVAASRVIGRRWHGLT